MDIYEQIDLQDCPYCGGPGSLEEDADSDFYIVCLDCGSQTAPMEYKTAEGRTEAAQKAAELWNHGKVVRMDLSE